MTLKVRNILFAMFIAIFASVSFSAQEDTMETNRKKAEAQLKAAREQAKKASRELDQKNARRPRRAKKKKQKHLAQQRPMNDEASKE